MIRPILFNAEMVTAILEDGKTATRRIIKKYIPEDAIWGYTAFTPKGYISCRGTWNFMPCIECRKENETCWKEQTVYEDRHSISEGCFLYRASHPCPEHFCWLPSIHMPKEAARIWLKIPYEAFNDPDNAYLQAKKAYIQIWDSTIKKKDIDLYSWKANPWVWVIEFERYLYIE